jgi:hypothetical protein
MAIGKVKFFNSQGWGFIVPGMVEQTCCGPRGVTQGRTCYLSQATN